MAAGDFDFGDMSDLSSKDEDKIQVEEQVVRETKVAATPPSAEAPSVTTSAASVADAEEKVEEDEDDLEIGPQLDEVTNSTARQANTTATTVGQTPVAAPNASSHQQFEPSDTSSDDARSSQTDHNLKNPNDPRMATQMSGVQARDSQRLQRESSNQFAPNGMMGNGGYGGGYGRNGMMPGMMPRPVVSLGVGAGIALAGKALTSSFKTVKDGISNAVLGESPRPMGVLERRATRDPVKAAQYYATSGAGKLREKIYRDQFNVVSAGVHAANLAHNDFLKHAGEIMGIINESPIGRMSDAAGIKPGQYIKDVMAGKITDQASKNVVKELKQNPEFIVAEKKLLNSGNSFIEANNKVLKNMSEIEESFPNRMKTDDRKLHLRNMAEKMNDPDLNAATGDEVSDFFSNLQALSEKITQALKKAVDKVAEAVSSLTRKA